MKSKKIFIIIIIAMIAIIVSVTGILKILDRKPYGLKKSGTLYDNMSNFSVLSEGNPDELTQSYLESITYEIINIDKDKMTATIEIQIPQISDELLMVIDKVISENKDAEYDELKSLAEKELADSLKSRKIDKNTETIILPIEETDGSYKIIPSNEWNALITGNLEELYIEYLKILIGGMTNEISQ